MLVELKSTFITAVIGIKVSIKKKRILKQKSIYTFKMRATGNLKSRNSKEMKNYTKNRLILF